MTPPPLPKTTWRRVLDGVAIGIVLAFAYVVLLFGLFATLAIVSPPLAEDQAFILFFSTVCTGMVVAPPVLVPALLRRLRTLPEDSLTTKQMDDSVAPMIRSLRIRSRLFKLGAGGVFLLIVMTTLLGFTVAQNPSENGTITGTGVTALALLLFLLRTLASIYRHNMRLASFYDSRADYLQAGGKTKGLDNKELLNVFSTDKSLLVGLKDSKTPLNHGSRCLASDQAFEPQGSLDGSFGAHRV